MGKITKDPIDDPNPEDYGDAASAVVMTLFEIEGEPKDEWEDEGWVVTANAAGFLAIRRAGGGGPDIKRRMARYLMSSMKGTTAEPMTPVQARAMAKAFAASAKASVDRYWPVIAEAVRRRRLEGPGTTDERGREIAHEELSRWRTESN